MIIISILHCHTCAHFKYVSSNTLVGMREVGRRSVPLVAILPLLLLMMVLVMDRAMLNDDGNSQIKNLLEFIEGRVLLSGAIPLALLGRC